MSAKVKRSWTDAEDRLLLSGLSDDEVSQRIKRSKPAMYTRRLRLKERAGLPRRSLIPWSDADVEALLELGSCTDEQVALYLGRTVSSIATKRCNLAKTGIDTRKLKSSLLAPFNIPQGAVLLAKTCPKCGKMRDAAYFRVMTRKHKSRAYRHYDPNCTVCYRDRSNRPSRAATVSDDVIHLQNITKPIASRSGEQYTSEDIELISDPDKSTLEVALTLGRTFFAIRKLRDDQGMDQRYSDLLPKHKPRGKGLPDSSWVIRFPAAAQALREHFEKLGRAVPEEFWEWNDTEEMAS